jgi:hypothetical protein
MRVKCRLCHRLAYQCRRESIPVRWERRAERIVERLGGEAEDGLVSRRDAEAIRAESASAVSNP